MGLFSSVANSISQFSPVIARQVGTTVVHGVNTGGGLYGRVNAVVTTTGSQSMTIKALRGYGDDYFNGWYAIGANCTNIADAEPNIIEDYTSSTGIFTFGVDWSGSPAVTDVVRIIPPEWMISSGGLWVKATSDASPLTSGDIFSISGLVKVYEIIGVVTTVIQTQATTVQLKLDADTGAGLDINLSAGSADLTAKPAGSLIRWTGDFSDDLQFSADSAQEAPGFDVSANGVIMYAGDITVTYGAASTGKIDWYARYEPIFGGTLVAS